MTIPTSPSARGRGGSAGETGGPLFDLVPGWAAGPDALERIAVALEQIAGDLHRVAERREPRTVDLYPPW